MLPQTPAGHEEHLSTSEDGSTESAREPIFFHLIPSVDELADVLFETNRIAPMTMDIRFYGFRNRLSVFGYASQESELLTNPVDKFWIIRRSH